MGITYTDVTAQYLDIHLLQDLIIKRFSIDEISDKPVLELIKKIIKRSEYEQCCINGEQSQNFESRKLVSIIPFVAVNF